MEKSDPKIIKFVPTTINTTSSDQKCKSVTDFEAKLKSQIIATCIATIGAFGLGAVLGWSSPAIPNLKSRGDLGIVNESEESWIGSLVYIGAMTSGLIVGFLMEKLGRKYTMILLQIPSIIGWILIILANNLWMMYVGRALTGFAGGSMTLIVPVYISEIVQDKIRGVMSSLMTLAIVNGVLFSYTIGALISWIGLSIACATIPIIALVCLIPIPDTPRSLLARAKEADAKNALIWLRGATSFGQVEEEFKEIHSSIDQSNKSSSDLKELLIPSIIKPVGISFAFMAFQRICGINVVLAYSVSILKSIDIPMSPNMCAILIAMDQVVITIVSLFIVDRFGRKPLLMISEIGMCLCLLVLGYCFYLKQYDGEVLEEGLIRWIPKMCLMLYIMAYGLGIGPLPWVLLAELTPSHIKGLAGGIANSFSWGLGFIVTRTFSDIVALITEAGGYWLFAAGSLLGALFTLFVLPETKGKSLDDINALFK